VAKRGRDVSSVGRIVGKRTVSVLGRSRGDRDVTLAETYSPLMSVTSTSVASSAVRRRSSTSCTDGMIFPRLWEVWRGDIGLFLFKE